ncbi:glycoside hydrolase family 108 protein [Marinibactrum halimedae]|uniref:N-acetylmuramidase n=1 Tax=Marinibactrum halimedae TaxID=1444977 RepID=A0AA37T756_9GAMM|nr:glycosyl hydrolase 108 family protein [Marinibactrum halimedae]MCD9458068.1 N-acetylmuramidase [Marinibactrum halimedae]GLS25001.1 hypothetical protein GCM10007877_07150 [Marinibactrum halimedae]
MAEFTPALNKMLRNEGGYIDHCVAGDRGGQTFAGISRRFHPTWPGWPLIDSCDKENPNLTALVYKFYRQQFWQPIKADYLHHQIVAESIFDFAVNAGVRIAVKVAQIVVDTSPDGIVGPKTLEQLNSVDDEFFVAKYALAKIARYREIVRKDRSQEKFLLGWINRTLEGVG